MLQKTNGIVLRSVKYGETSLVTTIFTATYGLQTYMVKGVRSSKAKHTRAGLFQPGTLLDLVVYQQPNKNLQHIREFQPAVVFTSLQQDVVRNSIVLFSVEVLLRLLPEHAPMPALFDFAYDYFIRLDKSEPGSIANYPLFFVIHCSRELGFNLNGDYGAQTPHLNLQEGGFTEHAPAAIPFVSDGDAQTLGRLLKATDYSDLGIVDMNAEMRMRLTDWYVQFLQQHTQHMGSIRSLSILHTVLH